MCKEHIRNIQGMYGEYTYIYIWNIKEIYNESKGIYRNSIRNICGIYGWYIRNIYGIYIYIYGTSRESKWNT